MGPLRLLLQSGARHCPPSLYCSSLCLLILGTLLLVLQQDGGGSLIEAARPSSWPSSPPPPAPSNCTTLATGTVGPYWVEENIEASNVRLNLSYGVPLNITFKVSNSTLSALAGACVPIEAARIDLWQCRYDGRYSDVALEKTVGEKWLRGTQYTNSTGYATFYTIYPGWYKSRTVHIHVRVRIYAEDGSTTLYEDTTQLFFNDTITEALFADVYPYNSRGSAVRDTFNDNDSTFRSSNVITLDGDYNDCDGYTSTVEMSLPFTGYNSALNNRQSVRISDDHGSNTFAAIL